PDHSEKASIFELLGAQESAGMSLTESWMMQPVSSVSALIFSHPESRYFSVNPLGDDQLQDYSKRKKMEEGALKKMLGL
ncbi:MAG: vitamin B12 dependent-methionine synthase activation domain-containing protein, partial [Akkermansia sp.]